MFGTLTSAEHEALNVKLRHAVEQSWRASAESGHAGRYGAQGDHAAIGREISDIRTDLRVYSARAAWDAACEQAERAERALAAAGNPRKGPVYQAWQDACKAAHNASDIWYAEWQAAGRPRLGPQSKS